MLVFEQVSIKLKIKRLQFLCNSCFRELAFLPWGTVISLWRNDSSLVRKCEFLRKETQVSYEGETSGSEEKRKLPSKGKLVTASGTELTVKGMKGEGKRVMGEGDSERWTESSVAKIRHLIMLSGRRMSKIVFVWEWLFGRAEDGHSYALRMPINRR